LSCSSNTAEKPKDLIDKDQMVAILYDLYVINAMKSSNMQYLEDRRITSASYILHKYKVDSLQFEQSDRYYASDVEEYEKLYQRVSEKLNVNKAVIDSLIAKNPEQEIKIENSAATPDKILKDPRKKKKLVTKNLFNDSIQN
jgi:hypothetical protein